MIVRTEGGVAGSLDPLHLLPLSSNLLFAIVHAAEEHGVEAHLVEEPCVGVGVTEWVDLPTNSWFDTKFLEDPLLTIHHVVNHVLIDWASLVMHGPSSVDDLKLSVLHKPSDLLLLFLGLLVKPH